VVVLGLVARAVLPDFRVGPDDLAFGQVPVGEQRILTVLLENTGNQDLRFTLSTGTPVYELEDEFKTVGEGETLEIAVRFVPSLGRQEDAILSIFHSLDDVRLIPISGEGVIPGVALAPRALDFGFVPVGSSKRQSLELSNTGDQPLEFIVLTGLEPPFEGETSATGALAPGASRRVDVVMTPTAQSQVDARFDILTDRGRIVVRISANSLIFGDFNENGELDYPDFFLFADAIGRAAVGEQERYDLDRSGFIDLFDFLLFSEAFSRAQE
jgi:hypothetical protein